MYLVTHNCFSLGPFFYFIYTWFFFHIGDIHLALFAKNARDLNGRHEQFMRDAIDDINVGFFDHPPRQALPGKFLKQDFNHCFVQR